MRRSFLTHIALWWKQTSVWFRIVFFASLAILFLLCQFLLKESDDPTLGQGNLLIFFVVNLNIIFLCGLGFLIGRNIVKLVFDRKHNILGSKLRLKLVVAFGGMVLVSTVALFAFAGGLLNDALESWFSVQVEDTVEGAVDIAKQHYAFLKQEITRISTDISKTIQRTNPDNLQEFVDVRRKANEAYSIRIVDESGTVFIDSHNAASVIESFSEPSIDKKSILKAMRGTPVVLFDDHEANQFIRSYSQLNYRDKEYALVVTVRVSPELTHALQIVHDSYKQYGQLKLSRGPLKTGYLLLLALITSVILFSAIWFAFYLARQLTDPIKELAEAMRSVSRGNYEKTLEATGDDEISFLIRSFNAMLADLQSTRGDAERRRLFIETILSRLAVGVIAINRTREITVANLASSKLLGLQEIEELRGVDIVSVVPPEVKDTIERLLEQHEDELYQREIELEVNGEKRKIVCTSGVLQGAQGQYIGNVFLFDDVTEIAKAQHVAVWREVARRIAHEIKNPLTPIQLSAQRLQKLITGEQAQPVIECVSSIVENVDLIKRLANEFSEFARMPTIEISSHDLNGIIQDVVELYGSSGPVFQAITDRNIPALMLDKEQIKRMFINLIDNALAAMRSESEAGRIVIKSTLRSGIVVIEVSDNGPGIPHQDRVRIFEPYYTTKKGGTGLGLAIVLSIVSDHQGTIRVVDNQPRGAKFIIELPIDPRGGAQRRLT